jgi:hypothetical protein
METFTIIGLIALILSLPGSLFLAFKVSARRARLLSLLLGLVGALVVAGAIYLYIHNVTISLDGISFFLGTFFACSVGTFTGALLANFAVGAGERTSDIPSTEY